MTESESKQFELFRNNMPLAPGQCIPDLHQLQKQFLRLSLDERTQAVSAAVRYAMYCERNQVSRPLSGVAFLNQRWREFAPIKSRARMSTEAERLARAELRQQRQAEWKPILPEWKERSMPAFTEMMSLDSKYLSAKELEGKEVQVTIKEYTKEKLEERDGSTKEKWVVWFIGHEKGLVLNKSNLEMLSQLFGTTEESIGKTVVLYWIAETGMGPGLRLRGVSAPADEQVPF